MRYLKIIFLKGVMLLLLGCFVCTHTLVASKTFFMPRSLQTDLTIFNATSTMFQNCNEPAERFSFSATTFYQESTNGRDLARYFLIGGKNELVIKGVNATGDRDISATWLQIAGKNAAGTAVHFPNNIDVTDEELYFNQFESKIKLHPEYLRFGTTIHCSKQFCGKYRPYIDIVLPFLQVQTNVHLKEFDMKNSVSTLEQISNFKVDNGTFATQDITRNEHSTFCTMLNAKDALNNPTWRYGKFKQGWQKNAGLADIVLKMGISPTYNEKLIWAINTLFVVPTSHKPKSENIFEPVLGNGKHFGLGFETNVNYSVYEKECLSIHFFTNLNYAYLFRNTQIRSFDLKANGEWSRYLLVFYPMQAATPGDRVVYPGINVFSDSMHVTPGSEINWTSLVNLNFNSFSFDLGYNLWWRQKENVCLARLWNKQVSIMHFSSSENSPFNLESFSKATIKDHFIGAPGALGANSDGLGSQVLVKPEDLNIESAAHPALINHKIYATIGYSSNWAQLPFHVAAGASYVVNEQHKTIQDWTLWIQCNIPI